MPPTLIDLFSGAGGISHGFATAGFRVLGGVDFDADAIRTFQLNHPTARAVRTDLESITPDELATSLGVKVGQVDCIAGGPPCQGFSRNRALRHQGGQFVDDPRNHLYWHFFEFVRYLRPRFVLMENVPEILIKANGAFRDRVFDRFRAIGYSVHARVLNAADFGVPQHRRRAFFLGGIDGQTVRFPAPTTLPGHRPGGRTPSSSSNPIVTTNGIPRLFQPELPDGPSVWDAVSDLAGTYADAFDSPTTYAKDPKSSYQKARRGSLDTVRNHYPWPLTERQLARVRLLKEGQGQAHLPPALRTRTGYGSSYRRMQRTAQALTLTTWMFHPGSGMFTHPLEDRTITIREGARLQSFQDSFVFLGRYHSQCRQLGNSVAPLVAVEVAKALQEALGAPTDADATTAAKPTPDTEKRI